MTLPYSIRPRLLRIIVMLLASVVLLAACNSGDGDSNGDEAADGSNLSPTLNPQTVAEGQELFSIFCAQCHGPQAQGMEGLGPALVQNRFIKQHSPDELKQFVIEGRPPGHPENRTGIGMPARGGFPNLSNEQIETITVYLRSLQIP
jgi:disulfide bond formation protein DsbB